jgi:hypothetical protein
MRLFWVAAGVLFRVGFGSKLDKVGLYFIVALCDELAVVPPCVEALTQSEEMFGTVIPYQRLCDCFRGGLDAIIAKAGKLERVPLSVDNRIEDGDATYPGDIADDMVQLQVHLIQCLLNALRIRACCLHQAVTMPQQGTQSTDLLRWSK